MLIVHNVIGGRMIVKNAGVKYKIHAEINAGEQSLITRVWLEEQIVMKQNVVLTIML